MSAFKVQISRQGRLVIPAALRKAAGIKPGSAVVLEAKGRELRLRSAEAALSDIQKKYKRLAKGRAVVDELIAERRAEAERE